MSEKPVTLSYKINYEAVANDLAAKVNEMESVLSWASENVWWIERFAVNAWAAGWTASRTENRGDTSPTLYAALKSAWEGRDK